MRINWEAERKSNRIFAGKAEDRRSEVRGQKSESQAGELRVLFAGVPDVLSDL
jgi:hypothetical protein